MYTWDLMLRERRRELELRLSHKREVHSNLVKFRNKYNPDTVTYREASRALVVWQREIANVLDEIGFHDQLQKHMANDADVEATEAQIQSDREAQERHARRNITVKPTGKTVSLRDVKKSATRRAPVRESETPMKQLKVEIVNGVVKLV